MKLDKFRTSDKNTYIIKPEDCIEEMLNSLKKGKVKGSTTHNELLDQCWTWRKQEANIWTGYANEGKSLALKQLCLIKALADDWRFIFCSPEDFPPEEFYDDLIHTLSGKTTDKDYSDNLITKEDYIKCYNLIKEHFIFLYIEPPHNTIKGVLEEFKKIIATQRIDGCIIDPILKFARPKDFPEKDDQYAAYVGSICVDFARQTNTSFHLVMHQTTPTLDSLTRKYPEPSMYRVKGGGSWSDGFDNVLSVWRPNYAIDKFDTTVQFSSQKIKKQKLVGIPQKISWEFNRKTNRYTFSKELENPIFNFDKFLK
jgi:twinkle protein